jgi:hypothetical protein
MEVVPMLRLSRNFARSGMRTPSAMPMAMAANIQSVRYLFRKESFFGPHDA